MQSFALFLALAIIALSVLAGGAGAGAIQATPTPTPREPLPAHVFGTPDAVATFMIYGDFQSTLCARYARDLAELQARYPDDVRVIWRHLPDVAAHDNAALALQASEAAAAQGAFWEMHDQLFTHQADWRSLSLEAFRAVLRDYAATVGLDVPRFEADLDARGWMVDAARQDAATLGIAGSPFLLLNGQPYNGRDDLFGLDEAVRLAQLAQQHFAQPPEMQIDITRAYRATLVTEKGDIVIELFPRDAPQAVNNFVFLARAGWYDDSTFHYVVPGYLAQTGDPSDTGRGGPGYTIPDEHDNGLRFDREGLVAMAHPAGVPDSAGSQFFITLAPLEPPDEWNGRYTIFGLVVEGMDVVHRLTPRNANDPVNFPAPPPGDRVLTVEIEES